jgi:hypothetical protein
VFTWHNDTYRTGQNLSEAVLVTPLSKTNFGLLCSASLDGQVCAQPLVVVNVPITVNGVKKKYKVAYVVTENDTLYAIDADPTDGNTPCSILNGPNGTSLLNGQSAASCTNVGGFGCTTIAPNVGILGTPVINIDATAHTATMYLVVETQTGNSTTGFTLYHYLHAVDIIVANPPHLTSCDNKVCPCTVTDTNIVQTFWTTTPNAGPVIHTSPAFWERYPEIQNHNDFLYISTQQTSVSGSGELLQYGLCDNLPANQPVPICGSGGVPAKDGSGNAIIFKNGVTPAISAANNTAADGIVWAIWSDGSVVPNKNNYNGLPPAQNGQLYAFDAVTMAKLYGSNDCTQPGGVLPDQINPATKFSVPTVANGNVYVGTQAPICDGTNNCYNPGTFYIFGLNPTRSCM